jgi:hypothetical protein
VPNFSPPKTKSVWVKSNPAPSMAGRKPSPAVIASQTHVWHNARPLRRPANGLRTLCGRDVPDWWDKKTRRSQPTTLKENERICLNCSRIHDTLPK